MLAGFDDAAVLALDGRLANRDEIPGRVNPPPTAARRLTAD